MPTGRRGQWSRRYSVRRSPWPTAMCRPRIGRLLRRWYWSPHEATLWAAVGMRSAAGRISFCLRAWRGAGNDDDWIHAAMRRAIREVADTDLDVKLVSYGTPSDEMLRLVANSRSAVPSLSRISMARRDAIAIMFNSRQMRFRN